MKITQKNSEGEDEEFEVLTSDEVQAKLTAEKEALEDIHKAELNEKENALLTEQNSKKELEDKIAKLEQSGMKEDHPNFKILKDALSKKDTEIKELSTKIDNDQKLRKTDEMNSAIKVVSRGNEELEKKIKLHLEKTLSGMPDNTKEERLIKLESALKLSADTPAESEGMFDSGISGGGNYIDMSNGSKVEFTSREKALGNKLGITDEDRKKYGPRLTIKN